MECGIDEHIRLRASVNGWPVRAVLDSGCTRTIIDQGLASRIGIQLQRLARFSGTTANQEGALTVPIQLDICGVNLSGVAGVVDLASLARVTRHQCDLLIGLELFRAKVIELDHINRRIRLSDRPFPSADMDALPVKTTRSGLYTATIEIVGCAMDAVIDLGCASPLFMSPGLAADLDLLNRFSSSTSASLGAEGIAISRITRLPCVTFAGVTLIDVPVEIPDRWNLDARIVSGLPIFSRLRSIMDFGHARIWTGPSRNTPPFSRDRSGLGVIPKAASLRVIHVAENSPAALAEIQPGDDIIEVNGEPITQAFIKSNRGLGSRAVGTCYWLSLSNGRHVEVTLCDYY